MRGAAVVEGVKGLLVLLVGLGLLSLAHGDVERFATGLVRHSHLNPASHYPHIFIEAAAHATDARLLLFALAAFAYASVRFVEAYGLWYERGWAEVFAVVTGAIYLPIEIYELIERATAVKFTVLGANGAIVACLAYAWRRRRRREQGVVK